VPCLVKFSPRSVKQTPPSLKAELLPESEDAFGGPSITTALAQIYVWTGDYDQAFRLLDHLLATPNGLTVPFLKLDPAWDPLRKDPRFQNLIDKHGGKT
jgi:hypothetical protein